MGTSPPSRRRQDTGRRSIGSVDPVKLQLLDGSVWAVPVPRQGYCPLIVARAPHDDAEVDFLFAYLQPTLSRRPQEPESIAPLTQWTAAWLGVVSTAPFRKGRWSYCGQLRKFDRDSWPVPPSRHSAVDETLPPGEWEKAPWGEMWSIEITADEPTLTLIANTPATRDEALRFPRTQVVNAASRLEKALARHFLDRKPLFWDMKLVLNTITPQSPRIWREFAERVRSATRPPLPAWLPAGRKTDRQIQAGAWLAFPLTGGGFGAALLIDRPDRHLRVFSDSVVMAMRRRWDHWPALEDVCSLGLTDGALVAQTSLMCVRDGRWRVLGYHDDFDSAEWVWPRPWRQSREDERLGQVTIQTARGETHVPIDPAILALDPDAGQRCNCMSSSGSIEWDVARIIAGNHPAQLGMTSRLDGIVTPGRLAAWRVINAALEAPTAVRQRMPSQYFDDIEP